MPELPEVETVRRTLKEFLIGKKIVSVETKYDKIIKGIEVKKFKSNLSMQTINDISRIGKYLIFILDDYALISHLRMEGKYFYRDECFLTNHDHICFKLDDGKCLVYNDTRKFGTMNLEDVNNYQTAPYLSKLGPEPCSINLTSKYLYDKIHNKNIAVKTALLDQTIISGLGNIYVDEVLFLSKLEPTIKCNLLTDKDFENIVESSSIVITKAIKEGGTTIKSFSSSQGVHGRFQNSLNVHTKKNCSVCNGEVTKIKVGGRGTYYCKNCQVSK